MDLMETLLGILGNQQYADAALFTLNALVGFAFGLSLVYMARRRHSRRRGGIILAVILGAFFYLAAFVLNDYDFGRRLVTGSALCHIILVLFVVLKAQRQEPRRRVRRRRRGTDQPS
jgi:peptidoglycan/LPS O-acetylase OafA/YrhL